MKKIYFWGCCLVFLFGACKKKKKEEVEFDRGAMLTNMADEVILPDFERALSSIDSLNTRAIAFSNNPTQNSLDSLQALHKSAWEAWQRIEVYAFGPAETLPYKMSVNVFPTDTVQIKNNVSAGGNADLSLVSNIDAKGFPALDYLLNGSSDATLLSNFTASNNRATYVKNLTADLLSAVRNVRNEWRNGYANTFKNATGLDIGGSTGLLVNYLSMESETVRREKIGNALGYTGFLNGGMRYPGKVESFYGGHSKALIVANLKALKRLFQGGNGIGFDDYLNDINAEFNGTPLANEINDQFDRAINAVNAIPGDLPQAVTTNFTEADNAFLQCKILVVRLKVDMSSQLGVSINYADNDGD